MEKNILFVVDNLAMGGITTVLVNLLKKLDFKKYNIDLLVLHYYDDMEISLPSNIHIYNGNKYFSYIDTNLTNIISQRNLKAFLGKLHLVFLLKTGMIKTYIKKSRKQILNKKYDTEIAFSDGFSHIFVANGNTPNKIAWMHTDISVRNDSKRYTKLIKDSLLKMNMNICVSTKVKEAYMSLYKLENCQVIHNIMNPEEIISKGNLPFDSPFEQGTLNLISVGRLVPQKNYSRFIKVHKKLIDEGYKIHSFIIGDGSEAKLLENMIKLNNINDSFVLLGRKSNPFPFIKNADLFVLPSDLEGLPTVLYESIILGTPCISTNVAGAQEILCNKYGIVVENSDESLYTGLKKLIEKKEEILNFRENLKSYNFDDEKIIKEIENIL